MCGRAVGQQVARQETPAVTRLGEGMGAAPEAACLSG